jgi:hypothetical protein
VSHARGRRRRRAAAALLALLAAACGKKDASQPVKPPLPAAPAVVVGSVRLAPGHELPSYEPEQMERSVLAHIKGGTFPEVCTPPRKDDRVPVKLSADGKLVGVMLAASEFSRPAPDAPPRMHDIAIKDCRLTPSMVVARIGDSLHVSNEVDFPLLPGLGSDAFNQTMSKGQSRDILLETGGVKVLMCGFTAPCGRTDVIVMAHPHADVTDAQGEFRIEDFPPDQPVRLNAWHPLFRETFVDVKVQRGETKRVELELTPVPKKPPPPPPAPPPDKNAKGPKQIIPD